MSADPPVMAARKAVADLIERNACPTPEQFAACYFGSEYAKLEWSILFRDIIKQAMECARNDVHGFHLRCRRCSMIERFREGTPQDECICAECRSEEQRDALAERVRVLIRTLTALQSGLEIHVNQETDGQLDALLERFRPIAQAEDGDGLIGCPPDIIRLLCIEQALAAAAEPETALETQS